MDEWREFLFRTAWSQSIPLDVQQEIDASVVTNRVPAESEPIRQGDEFGGLLCVLEGRMKVVGTARRGEELLIGILRPGDWTGFLSALDRLPYAFSVRAVDDCRIARLGADATKRIFERDIGRFRLLLNPEISVSRNTYRYFVELAYQPPMQRLAERMLGLGRWPYSVGKENPVGLEAISQSDLANATRLSRQTINSILKVLARHGLVEIGYKSVQILDVDRLALVAGGDLSIE